MLWFDAATYAISHDNLKQIVHRACMATGGIKHIIEKVRCEIDLSTSLLDHIVEFVSQEEKSCRRASIAMIYRPQTDPFGIMDTH